MNSVNCVAPIVAINVYESGPSVTWETEAFMSVYVHKIVSSVCVVCEIKQSFVYKLYNQIG